MLLLNYQTHIWTKKLKTTNQGLDGQKIIQTRKNKGIGNAGKKKLSGQFFVQTFFVQTTFFPDNFVVQTKGHLPPRGILPTLIMSLVFNLQKVQLFKICFANMTKI